MRWIYKLPLRVRSLFRKDRAERELDEELRFHVEKLIEENVAKGMTPEKARYAALREFGGVEQLKEECRDSWGVRMISELGQDVRYGLRQLRRNPGFTIVAVLTLALGIGANTAIFSVVDAVMFQPLPYHDPSRLVMLWERNPAKGIDQEKVSGPNFIDWRQQNHVLDSMAFWPGWLGAMEFNLITPGGTEKVRAIYASSALFSVLGVKPIMGRALLPEEDNWQGNRVALISHELWQTRFGADPQVLGRTLTLDSYGRRDYTIVGVMPSGFRFPSQCELWLPAGWMGVHLGERRSAHWHSVIARLKPGVAIAQAQSEMSAIQARIAQGHPNDMIGTGVAVVPLLNQTIGQKLRATLLILWGVVACVLLVACANMANLLLARGAGRQKEIAVRIAVGASRWRVVRQLMTESVILALGGGLLGLFGAMWGLRFFIAMAAGHVPRLQGARLDAASLAFTLGVCLITSLFFGLAPACQISKPVLNRTLKKASRSGDDFLQGGRLRSVLVVLEIALSLVLLVGAGLMTRSLVSRLQINRGFQPNHLLTAQLDFSVSGFTSWVHPTATSPQVTLTQIMERFRNNPGVVSVAVAYKLPRDVDKGLAFPVVIENRPSTTSAEYPTADFQGVSPDYFRTMEIPLLQGRPFTEDDVYEALWVAIINQTMARRYFPNQDPIGKRLAIGGRKDPGQPDFNELDGRPPWKLIVGVVADTKSLGPRAETVPEVYVPYWQWPMQNPALLVRTTSNAALSAAAIRSEVRAVNKNLPPPVIRSMDEILADSVAQPRYQTILLDLFGIAALVLAAIGIYGVISYSVAQRRHEIGIRIALGAEKSDVLKMVIEQGLKLTLIGVAIGIVGALALTRFLSSLLYGVKPTDPLTFIAVSLILFAVALLACYIPARRAAKVDPMVALRYE